MHSILFVFDEIGYLNVGNVTGCIRASQRLELLIQSNDGVFIRRVNNQSRNVVGGVGSQFVDGEKIVIRLKTGRKKNGELI